MPGRTEAHWTPARAALLEAALRASWAEGLTHALWSLRRRLPTAALPREAERGAFDLGLVEAASAAHPRLTPLGAKVSDSLTEYGLWKSRGRLHHFAQEVPALGIERLRGRRILEIGCGAGVNLLSLQRCADVVGLDVEPLYLQLSAVFARVENLPAPLRVCASAERLPFGDASFDIALFHGSLPYMRIEQALREAARVLRPGGRAIAVLGDLRQMATDRLRARRWTLLRPGIFLREARGIGGTIAYPWVGRLILKPTAPVHSTRRRMRLWLSRAGLRPNAAEESRGPREVCYVADKPLSGRVASHRPRTPSR